MHTQLPQEQAKAELLKRIKNTFAEVRLDNGVGLLETEIIDAYGTAVERAKAREKDEKQDWTQLIDSAELKRLYAIGGLPFFDDKGFRFHLPAYMCTTLHDHKLDVFESLMFSLTDMSSFNLNRIKILNEDQKEAVYSYLTYLRDFELSAEEQFVYNLDNVLDQFRSLLDS